MIQFLKLGVTHAIMRDLLFLLVYNIVGSDGVVESSEMILSFLIPCVLCPIIISKLFNISYTIPILISCITLIVPNFIPNVMWLTYSKNINELMTPFGLSIACYVILYLISSIFIN
jgi:hypothetical protein